MTVLSDKEQGEDYILLLALGSSDGLPEQAG